MILVVLIKKMTAGFNGGHLLSSSISFVTINLIKPPPNILF
ncbi:hypothetical protein [uncultured Acetobacterium sp.]|nr:hypothetical protein [uncultured Acetobacterium sp.]